MSMIDWSQKHNKSIIFVLISLSLTGIISIFSLPVGLFPQISFPRVLISLDAGDRPAERMAIEVTRRVENIVRSVPKVRNVRSTTSRGSAEISINFDWGTDMIAATLQVESAINQIYSELPPQTRFEVRRMDPTVFPVLGYSLTSEKHSLTELRDIGLYQLRPILSTINGVARVEIQGGKNSEYQVIVNPDKLRAYSVTLQEIASSLQANNVLTAVGRLEENYKLYLVLSNTRLESLEQIKNTIVKTGENGVVRVEDIASVNVGVEPQWIRVTADGHKAVLFQIYQQPGGNTVGIARACDNIINKFKKNLGKDIKISKWYDQSLLVTASALSVRDALWIGVLLASIVLFIFLRNIKITFIAIFTVPMVLATTVLMLKLLGMSFNIMTLGGMAAAVALIVDDAIVMIEHIMRRVKESSDSYINSVTLASKEFTSPLAGSSASTIIIFAPFAFLSGVTGAFFKALSLTMAAGLVVSFMASWIVVPIFAKYLLTSKDAENEEQVGVISKAFQAIYSFILTKTIRFPFILILFIVPFLFAGYSAYTHVGSGFMPDMDEGGFILDYRAEPGTSLSETNRLLVQVEDILKKTPEVLTYSRRTGTALGGFLTEANEGDFFVRLRPLPRRSLNEVMDEVRNKVEKNVPGLEIELVKLMADLIGDLTSVPQPIEIKLYCDDGKLLQKIAPKIADNIKNIKGIVDVSDGIIYAGDAINIRINRIKAALEGVDPDKVTNMLSNYLAGAVPTSIMRSPKIVAVRVWIAQNKRNLSSKILQLPLRSNDGHIIPLHRIAKITHVSGQSQICRENLKRMIAVTGRISGRDMGSTVKDVLKMLNKPNMLPAGMYYELGGLYKQQQIAFKGLIMVLLAAVVLVFALILYLYESFRVAFAMLSTSLFATIPVFIGLYLTKTDLNITAMMGIIMIVGIVTEVSIFYYSEYADLKNIEEREKRLVAAGNHRIRPISMTTIAAILALMPLALAIGEGSAMLQPLAIAIISGLIAQLPLVLIGLPTLLSIMNVGKNHTKNTQ